jgi:hypothetical protein
MRFCYFGMRKLVKKLKRQQIIFSFYRFWLHQQPAPILSKSNPNSISILTDRVFIGMCTQTPDKRQAGGLIVVMKSTFRKGTSSDCIIKGKLRLLLRYLQIATLKFSFANLQPEAFRQNTFTSAGCQSCFNGCLYVFTVISVMQIVISVFLLSLKTKRNLH